MSNKEILTKAIEKAVENGFRLFAESSKTKEVKTILGNYDEEYYQVIFSHSFAKAFFGEGNYQYVWMESKIEYECSMCGSKCNGRPYANGSRKEDGNSVLVCSSCSEKYDYSWSTHLQQMVLCEEPLKYLEKFL